MSNIKILSVIIILIMISSVNSFSQEKQSKASQLIETSNGAEFVLLDDYDINLFPGVNYTGHYYFWSNGSSISANLQESPPVSWLSLSPTSFTSTSCSDIKVVSFTFTAPVTLGLYTTTINDLNANWTSINVNLTVTNNPTLNRYDSTVTIIQGASTNRYHLSSYSPFTNMGCNSSYAPGAQCQTVHTLNPSVPWLTINPNNFFVNLNSSVTVQKTFSYNAAGSYNTMECRTKQWYSSPTYIKWTLNVSTSITKISENIPSTYSIQQNYPNPFNPTTKIKFDVVRLGDVKIVVYDVMGREVQTLVNESLKPGTYEASFDGSTLNSGVYFYKISVGEFIETRKMILLK